NTWNRRWGRGFEILVESFRLVFRRPNACATIPQNFRHSLKLNLLHKLVFTKLVEYAVPARLGSGKTFSRRAFLCALVGQQRSPAWSAARQKREKRHKRRSQRWPARRR